MQELLSMKGKRVMVTGAGQGVGRQIVLHCAEQGADVLINDFFLDRAEAVADEVRALGANAAAAQCDVSQFGHVMAMVDKYQSEQGPIDVLVNNAGNSGPIMDALSAPIPPFWETNPEDWEPWLGTNLYGVLNSVRAVMPQMVERKTGKVISMISDAGRVGEPHLVLYSGAKAGVAGFSRALAKSAGRYNINVNCVSLSTVRTPGVESVLKDPERVKKILQGYMIRRLGEPSEAANMVLFLASAAGDWITGQTYPVNGGYTVSV